MREQSLNFLRTLVNTPSPVGHEVRGQRIWLLTTTGNGTVLGTPQAVLTGEFGRLRALVAAPDGSLWASTSNQEDVGDPGPDDDRIIRIVFSDGGAGVT